MIFPLRKKASAPGICEKGTGIRLQPLEVALERSVDWSRLGADRRIPVNVIHDFMVRSFDFHQDGNITQASFRFPYVFFIPGLILTVIPEIRALAQMSSTKTVREIPSGPSSFCIG
jgi:hypothetical protein